MGICFTDDVKTQNYAPNGTSIANTVDAGANKGVYLLNFDGYEFSDSITEDNGKHRPQLTFHQEEDITVELEYRTGVLRYRKNDGTMFTQQTSIKLSEKREVRYCVMLHGPGNDISIIV